MSYYNHFSQNKYKQILFSSLNIGDKFRQDFFKNRRRRTNIICIKTGELEFIEERNKQKHILFSTNLYLVSSFNELNP